MHKSGATVGAFRNSIGRNSGYAGWTWQAGPFGLTAGAITGYPRAKVLPLLVPSYRLASGVRISVVPNPFGAAALHLSLEHQF